MTKSSSTVSTDTDKGGNVLPVTEAELREDRAATEQLQDVVADLTKQATSIRKGITELEDAAADVTDRELLAEAALAIQALRMKLCRLVSLATQETYTAEDVAAWFASAMRRGASFPRVRGDLIEDLAKVKQVPVVPLRELLVDYLESAPGTDYRSIVRAAHDHLVELEQEHGEDYGSSAWQDTGNNGPDKQFQTHIGMRERNDGKGGLSFKSFISYERAVAISRAIGLNPIQAGV